jgi:hypothetical protein
MADDGEDKPVLFTDRYYEGPKYLEAKAKVMALLMKSPLLVTKNHIREETGLHAYVVDRILSDFVVEGRLDKEETVNGFMWKWKGGKG